MKVNINGLRIHSTRPQSSLQLIFLFRALCHRSDLCFDSFGIIAGLESNKRLDSSGEVQFEGGFLGRAIVDTHKEHSTMAMSLVLLAIAEPLIHASREINVASS
jgi:hypothetical protein